MFNTCLINVPTIFLVHTLASMVASVNQKQLP